MFEEGAPTLIQQLEIARAAYAAGENVTEKLREISAAPSNDPGIVEIAYDLQAGTYIGFTEKNLSFVTSYAEQLARHLKPHLRPGDTIFDAGTGELTTLTHLVNQLQLPLARILACDISWSRLNVGVDYAAQYLRPPSAAIEVFAADIGELPLRSKSVDVVISSHALEPNGGRESALLSELFRVARRKAVLFEPCYEENSDAGRDRMERLGYVRGLGEASRSVGGTVKSITPLPLVANDLNRTACYVLTPPPFTVMPCADDCLFSDPGTDSPLIYTNGTYFSPSSGLSYPVIDSIPVLRLKSAVITSARQPISQQASR